jgi:hypothetical protein
LESLKVEPFNSFIFLVQRGLQRIETKILFLQDRWHFFC